MLSKSRLSCILEAENEISKRRNRVHGFIINIEANVENRFRKFYDNIRNTETKFSATTEC